MYKSNLLEKDLYINRRLSYMIISKTYENYKASDQIFELRQILNKFYKYWLASLVKFMQACD